TDGTTPTNSIVTQNAGFIGIGTTSPNSNLHIQNSSQDVTFNFENTGPGGHAYRWDATNNVSAFGGGKLVLQDSTSGRSAGLTFASHGFVGFNTSSPGSNLEIVGNSQDMTFNFNNTGPGGHAYRWDSTSNVSAFGGGKLVLQDLAAGGASRFTLD